MYDGERSAQMDEKEEMRKKGDKEVGDGGERLRGVEDASLLYVWTDRMCSMKPKASLFF